jgi:hypothetical protein
MLFLNIMVCISILASMYFIMRYIVYQVRIYGEFKFLLHRLMIVKLRKEEYSQGRGNKVKENLRLCLTVFA